MRFKTMSALLCMLAAGLAGCASSSDPNVERFTAFAVSMGTAATGAKTQVHIAIERYSTDEEREHLLATLIDKGRQPFVAELGKQKRVGFVRLGGSIGYDLQYAREHREAGVRRIILVTDRPISFAELVRGARTRDYDVGMIELVLRDSGENEGSLAAAVELKFDKANNQLVIETWSSEPARLLNVMKQ